MELPDWNISNSSILSLQYTDIPGSLLAWHPLYHFADHCTGSKARHASITSGTMQTGHQCQQRIHKGVGVRDRLGQVSMGQAALAATISKPYPRPNVPLAGTSTLLQEKGWHRSENSHRGAGKGWANTYLSWSLAGLRQIQSCFGALEGIPIGFLRSAPAVQQVQS